MKLLHLLTSALLFPIGSLAQISPPPAAGTAPAIQTYLDSLASEEKLSGVIVVAQDGVPIASKAAGVANRTTGAPIRLDTKFNIGSMNKMFTSIAIAQLAQAGRLKFDDRIGKHLPDFANKEVADKVTIHHLLTHTSGMGMYTAHPDFRAQRAKLTSIAAHLPFIVHEPLAFAPGAKFQYSNSGFMVLGAIVEKLTGQDYHSYVQERIYKPAGMLNTGFYKPDGAIENLAVGYTRMGPDGQRRDELSENTDRIEIRGGPAGGGYSTAEDLVKFHGALRGFKLLNREYTEIVTTGKFDVGGPIGRYAYGFGDRVTEGKRIVGHNGGWPGVAVQLDMYPDTGHTAVVLMNADPPNMMPVVQRLRQLVPAK